MLGRIDWKPDRPRIRTFAITLVIASWLFGALLLLSGRTSGALYVASVGTTLGVCSYLLPRAGKFVYLFWMGLSYILGRIFSPVMTALIFFLMVTPIGLLLRLFGRDPLRLRRPPKVSSYFAEHPDLSDREHFRRQF